MKSVASLNVTGSKGPTCGVLTASYMLPGPMDPKIGIVKITRGKKGVKKDCMKGSEIRTTPLKGCGSNGRYTNEGALRGLEKLINVTEGPNGVLETVVFPRVAYKGVNNVWG